jgi:dTDP-4-dehydrorhamnose reductase
MDILDPLQIQRVIEKYHPDAIIHTAAMTNVDACESDRENCYALNVGSVKSLIRLSEQVQHSINTPFYRFYFRRRKRSVY